MRRKQMRRKQMPRTTNIMIGNPELQLEDETLKLIAEDDIQSWTAPLSIYPKDHPVRE